MKLARILLGVAWLISVHQVAGAAERDSGRTLPDASPQLPRRMHTAMTDLPRVTVGVSNAQIIGKDNAALQSAVDYLAGLGGGTVEIGPGEYTMRDSLHLRSLVTVRGTPGKTILRKADGPASPLAVDGDFGEEQVAIANPAGFEVGGGIAVRDNAANGFHVTVARITGRRGNVFSIDHPLMSDCMVSNGGIAAAVFPVVSGCDIEQAHVQDLIVEGNKEHNAPLDGCRGGGIYFYRAFNSTIERCTVRRYNGDGISFQQSNDVTVTGCTSEENASLGIHPGSGSQRAVVRGCTARRNGDDGLYLCWRVRNGLFEQNVLEGNGRFGISIGHKDTDNLLRDNKVIGNGEEGIFFRNESLGMAGHRNDVENNLIENNGVKRDAAGIRIRGETRDVILRNNQIRDTRSADQRRQKTGIQLDEAVGPVKIDGNTIDAAVPVKDNRAVASSERAGK